MGISKRRIWWAPTLHVSAGTLLLFVVVGLLAACGGGGGESGSSSATPPAETPTISGVSGTVQSGQILTITGTGMIQEDRTNWDPFFLNNPGASGFEGPSFLADGWLGGVKFTYVSDVKLMGQQSALSHHAGAADPINQHTNVSYSNGLSIGGDLYFRAYLRFKVANGIWADGYHKIFAMYGNLTETAFLDWLGNPSGTAYQRIAIITDSDYSASIPGGPLQEDRWYCVEFKVPSGTGRNYKAWIDNRLVLDVDGPWAPAGTAYDMQFDVNHCCTPTGYSKDNWWDGIAVSNSRVGPASIIEIGSSPDYAAATKVYQAPEFLSDELSRIKVDLTGLGAGPYYLWVTNNRGLRSEPHRL